MGINTTVIPSRIDASATDGEYITTTSEEKLTLGDEFFKQQAQTEIEIVELQANASVTPIDHDTLLSDTFSDSTGYEDSVNTGNTTATFDTNKYKRVNDASDGEVDSYLDATQDSGVGSSTANLEMGTTFTSSESFDLVKMNLRLRAFGSPTGNMTANIYTLNGSNEPDTLLATSDSVDISTLTGSYAWVEFAFSTPISLTATNQYYVVIEDIPTDASNYVQWASNNGGTVGEYIARLNVTTWVIISDKQRSYQTFEAPRTNSTKVVEIDLPTLSGTVLATELVLNDLDRETGDNITYDVTDGVTTDSGFGLDEKNDTTLASNPTKIKINLVPKTTGATTGKPAVKTYCLKLWKQAV